MVLEPPASRKPWPRAQLEPSSASHPPPQTQWANSGYVPPASRAVEAQIAPNRQRSAPAPSGIVAANPTLSICSQKARETEAPSRGSPRRKNGWAASQFQDFPPASTKCAGSPGKPCQEKPQTKYTTAATAMTHSAASIA